LWTELESRATLTNLLVELRANFPVDRIQVLVSQADISHGAIRVQESVINDAIVVVDGGATHGTNTIWLKLPIVTIHLVRKFFLVEIRVELFHLLDELLIVDY